VEKIREPGNSIAANRVYRWHFLLILRRYRHERGKGEGAAQKPRRGGERGLLALELRGRGRAQKRAVIHGGQEEVAKLTVWNWKAVRC
jgi:hypothetical protein